MIAIEFNRRSLFQWDKGQRVILPGIPEGAKIHFSHTAWPEEGSLVVLAYAQGDGIYADIPNLFLTRSGKLTVCVYLDTGSSGRTASKREFVVEKAEKPNDYVYTETEVLSWWALDKRISALEQGSSGGGGLNITDDGNGNVTIASTGSVSITDDGEGNVTIA